jgi:hypothetical protein
VDGVGGARQRHERIEVRVPQVVRGGRATLTTSGCRRLAGGVARDQRWFDNKAGWR